MKIEFIESYIKKDDGDYFWNDNHGELIRCKDCKHREEYECNNIMLGGTRCGVTDDWFCADGEKRENE